MITQTPAHIYLQSQRKEIINERFRMYETLEGKKPIGNLIALNEVILGTGQSCNINTDILTEIILLPIIGGLELVSATNTPVFLSVGETFRFFAFPESDFKVANPYPTEKISYLQIHILSGFSADEAHNLLAEVFLESFSTNEINQLLPAFTNLNRSVIAVIGQYNVREEGIYALENPDSAIFAFIINGAFEVQNRLLEKGDALALWSLEEVGFEALCDGAVILLMEIGVVTKKTM
jgi:hypothetical protein